MKRGGAVEEEEEHQADSIYRGGEWLEGVSGRRVVAAGPPLVKRVDSEDSAADRIPDIVTGVVMNYSFMQVLFSSVLSIIIFSCSFLPVPHPSLDSVFCDLLFFTYNLVFFQ